jgi:hypothetical protein
LLKRDTDKTPVSAIFSEEPELGDKHVLNYARLLGVCFRDFRANHPVRGLRTQEQFAIRRLTPYFDSVVSRKRVIRAEKVDVTISFGIVAAYFNEMDVWADIINVCTESKANDGQYMKLVTEELVKKEKERTRHRMESLHNNFFNKVGDDSK